MDLYIKSLSVSNNNTKEDVAYHCIKLLDWVYKNSFLSNDQISSKDLLNFAKAVVYLNTCYGMFGDDLTKYLLENYSFYEDLIKGFFSNTHNLLASVERLFINLANKNEKASVLCSLESIFYMHSQHDVHGSAAPIQFNYTLNFVENDDSEITENSLILVDLLKSLLQLSSDEINVAIHRVLENLPFSVIGLIFSKTLDSYYNDICLIIAEEICQQISDICISKFFIRSLYHSVSISRKGRELFWLCLAQVRFAEAIQEFLLKAVSEINKMQPNFCDCPEQFSYKEHKLIHILYLTWCALAPESPCQQNLYKSISDSNISSSFFSVINIFNRIYEC